jgi:hypothetical protein
MADEGRKDDQGKNRWELLPGDFLDDVAYILTLGAEKYADRNWERGMAWSRPFGALMRHMWAWWQGQPLDVETGRSHLAHAACCILFLGAYERRKIGTDDRPLRPGPDVSRDRQSYLRPEEYGSELASAKLFRPRAAQPPIHEPGE